MSEAIASSRKINMADIFAVRSDRLKDLRVIINAWRESNVLLRGAVQFRLVVDSNVVLGDIIWLVSKRKDRAAKTQLMETIEAETIELYVPPSLFTEVDEKIPLIAKKKKLDIDLMYAHWETYKLKLKVYAPDDELVQALKNGVDPDDAVFVALAETIAASGVFSKDKDIGMMGANQISIECITHLRNYSRATAIELNIKVNGVLFANVGIAAIRGLFAGIKALIDGIGRAPDWVKLALLAGVLFIALHPGARASVVRGLKAMLAGISEATPAVISYIAEAAALAEKHKNEAKGHLDKAMAELGRNETRVITQG
jgi:predicted nucleic acid-binding protein